MEIVRTIVLYLSIMLNLETERAANLRQKLTREVHVKSTVRNSKRTPQYA
jgi:hypothetical protein